MAVYSFVFLILLVLVSLTKSEKVDEEFREKVKNLLSDETFQKNFGGKYTSADELVEAANKATAKFDKVLGATISDSLSKELAENARRLADSITPTIIFDIYASAISHILKEKGKLSSDNVDKMASSFADYLKQSAKGTKGKTISETFPTLTAGVANYFKSLGLSSDKFANQFAKSLLKVLASY